MFTKLEVLREQEGKSSARPVFDMSAAEEGVYHTMDLYITQARYAGECARKVVRMIEQVFEQDREKNGELAAKAFKVALVKDRQKLKTKFALYGVAEAHLELACDLVKAAFVYKLKKEILENTVGYDA